MTKKHPGRNFMLGALIGSTIGAVSAMMFTTKKGHSIHHDAMHKLHEFEDYVKRMFHKNKGHVKRIVHKNKTHVKKLVTSGKRKVMSTMKNLHKANKRKKTKGR